MNIDAIEQVWSDNMKEIYVRHIADPTKIIAITIGEIGYRERPLAECTTLEAGCTGITQQIEDSYVAGSMFGWDCPAAQLAIDWATGGDQ